MKNEERTNYNKLKEETRKTIDGQKVSESLEQNQKNAAASFAWTWKGWFLFILGKVEEARKCYDKSIELDPVNLYGWSGKLWTNFILGKVADLIETTEKVTEINSENKYAWNIKGCTNFILGKVNKSLDCYEKYIEIDKRYGQSVPHGTLEPDIQHGTSSPDTIIGGGGNDIF